MGYIPIILYYFCDNIILDSQRQQVEVFIPFLDVGHIPNHGEPLKSLQIGLRKETFTKLKIISVPRWKFIASWVLVPLNIFLNSQILKISVAVKRKILWLVKG